MITDSTEMTLRAEVQKEKLQKLSLPDPVRVTAMQAQDIAKWARPFSGTCLTDTEILVNDIRPSTAQMVLIDLGPPLVEKLAGLISVAARHGFGLRLMRENPVSHYQMSIVRKVIDTPQLSVPFKALRVFLEILSGVDVDLNEGSFDIDHFSSVLLNRYEECLNLGCAHYQEYCKRIVDYGRAHGASRIIWGPERRGLAH